MAVKKEQETKTEQLKVVIRPLRTTLVRMVVIGVTDATTQRPDKGTAEMLTDQSETDKDPKKPKAKPPKKTPEEKFELATWRTKKGEPGIPSGAFQAAMVTTATKNGIIDPKEGRKGRPFHVLGGVIPLKETERYMREDICLRKGAGGKYPVVVYRPGYTSGWEATLDLWVNLDGLPLDSHGKPDLGMIKNLADLAGFEIGVGSHRPERKGNLGLFRVKSFDVITDRDELKKVKVA